MTKDEFLDKYYSINRQIDSLLKKSCVLEKEYIESSSPIKAEKDSPVLCEVEVTTEYINHLKRVREITTVRENKYLTGYRLLTPFNLTAHIDWETHDRKNDTCFVCPVFHKVKSDGTMSAYEDDDSNPMLFAVKSIVFWEKGKDDRKYMCNFRDDIFCMSESVGNDVPENKEE